MELNLPSSIDGWLQLLVDHPSTDLLVITHAIFIAHRLRTLPGAVAHNRAYPLAGWVTFMLLNTPGSYVTALLLGGRVGSIANDAHILMSSGIWYFMFFSPLDLVFSIYETLGLGYIIAVMEGVRNAHKIVHTHQEALLTYPTSWIAPVIVTIAAVCASSFMFRILKYIRSISSDYSYFKLSFMTKVLMLTTLLYGVSADPTSTWNGIIQAGLSPQIAKLVILVVNVVGCIGVRADPTFDPLSRLSYTKRLLFGTPAEAAATGTATSATTSRPATPAGQANGHTKKD